MKSPATKPPAAPSVSFEAALQELEGLVQALEGGGTPLEESLKSYERGVTLLKYCQETLAQAEQRIRLLDKGNLQGFNTGEQSVGNAN